MPGRQLSVFSPSLCPTVSLILCQTSLISCLRNFPLILQTMEVVKMIISVFARLVFWPFISRVVPLPGVPSGCEYVFLKPQQILLLYL